MPQPTAIVCGGLKLAKHLDRFLYNLVCDAADNFANESCDDVAHKEAADKKYDAADKREPTNYFEPFFIHFIVGDGKKNHGYQDMYDARYAENHLNHDFPLPHLTTYKASY